MLKNYLTVAWRNLWKNKTSTFINVVGLSIGLTSCILIAAYIQHELGYDHFQTKGDRITRVIMEYSFAGSSESNKGNFTSVRVAPVFKNTFPEVESAIRMSLQERVIRYKGQLISEKNFMYADSNFFDIFSFKLVRGDPHKVLNAPYQVVITTTTAKKYFGTGDPIGKVLQVGDDTSLYQVTGIIEDCPSNSQMKFDFLASFASLGLGQEYAESYWDANYTTYLLLKDAHSISTLQSKIPAFMKKEMEGKGATVSFFLEPFYWIHLHSPYGGFEPNNNIAYIYILGAVGLLILVIVCSTYINLSTARAMERAKEVGIRKVIGAGRTQLFWQFMGEATLLFLLSVVLSILVAAAMLPYFNQLSERNLQISALFAPQFLAVIVLLVISLSLGAGTYPALILTRMLPARVLKGSFKKTRSGQSLRRSLIVFQFSISVFLIVATLIMQKQLYYVQHKKLGYDRSHVLVLPVDASILPRLSLIKQEFKTDPGVICVSRCVRSPVEGGGGYNMRSAAVPEDQQMAVTANPCDEDFVKTTGLHIVAGSDLTSQDVKDVSSDQPSNRLYHFILNESAARLLGWTPEQAVGKKMFLDNSRPGVVRGVVEDFHFRSLHEPIKPFLLFPELRARELLVKLDGHHLDQTIAFLENKWKVLIPDRPFEYRFMDDDYNKLYNAELRLSKVMDLFSVIAISLACFGLFGLSSYSAQQREKEVGIRKVLGASAGSIIVTLSRDFIGLAAISLIVAFPAAWWATSQWLGGFAYRVNIGADNFLLGAAVTLTLAFGTVAIHALRAAIANPIKHLRNE